MTRLDLPVVAWPTAEDHSVVEDASPFVGFGERERELAWSVCSEMRIEKYMNQ